MKRNGININTPTVWQYILLVAVFACIATAHIREKLRLSRFDSIVIVLRFPAEQMRKKDKQKKRPAVRYCKFRYKMDRRGSNSVIRKALQAVIWHGMAL